MDLLELQAQQVLIDLNQSFFNIIGQSSEVDNSGGSLGAGALSGIIIGAVVLLALIAVAVYFLKFRGASPTAKSEAQKNKEFKQNPFYDDVI